MPRSGRIRLFCALLLPDDAVERLASWQVQLDAGRPVVRENLHVTLTFLGHRPEDELPGIVAELQAAAAVAGPVVLEPVEYRETRSVGMVVLDDVGGTATALADDLGGRLERLGVYRREARPWLPHVTVLRFRDRPRLAPPHPPEEPISPSDAAVYSSVLRPGGAQYVILETVALGGR